MASRSASGTAFITRPICWRIGVAPTRKPVLRSCEVVPPFDAAMETMPPTESAVTKYGSGAVQPSTRNAREVKSKVATVIPEIGFEDVLYDDSIGKVSLIGAGMRSHPGIASQMLRTLAEEGINIQMISTSEIKTSVVIDEKYMELAVRALHRAFELDQSPV